MYSLIVVSILLQVASTLNGELLVSYYKEEATPSRIEYTCPDVPDEAIAAVEDCVAISHPVTSLKKRKRVHKFGATEVRDAIKKLKLL